jgi:uncharacterized protein involved in exopolysaccharide biosynthesis
MQSTTVADRLIDQYKLQSVYDEPLRSLARQALAERTRIGVGKRDGLVAVEVDDHDPARAAELTNAYVVQLRRLTAELAITEAQQRRLFFERQLEHTKARLAAAQRAMQAAGINEGNLRAEPKAAAESYARLRAEATAIEVRIQGLRSYLTESASEIQQAQGQLAALRAQLARAEAVDASASQGDYIDRFREFKYQETLFDLFSRQFELAKLDESREGAVIQVVDAASPPERKSGPRRAVIAVMATLGAGLMLLVWTLARAAIDHSASQPASRDKLAALQQQLRRAFGRP